MNPFKLIAKTGRKMIKPMAKLGAKMKNAKPEIFVGTGLILMVGSFVWVAVSAAKAPEVMTESADKVRDVEDKYAALKEEEHTEAESKAIIQAEKKELFGARADGIMMMVKLFGGPVLLLILGGGLIVRGHHMLRVRNAILGATLKSTEKMFKYYRENVIAAEGKDADERYMKGIIGEKELLVAGTDENGNPTTTVKTVPVIRDGNPWRFEFSPMYFRRAEGVPDHDLNTLQQVEGYFNHLYNGPKKHDDISMYEVLEYLSPVWEVLDPDGSVRLFARNHGWGHDKRGDDCISLGVFNAINDSARHGVSESVFFEFNCDGRLETLVNQYTQRYLNA